MATPVSRIVDGIFRDYDHNRNGAIEGHPTRTTTHTSHMGSPRSDFDTFRQTTTTYSHDRLFTAADANGDGRVTRSELTAAVVRFDRNQDGKLQSRGLAFWEAPDELQRFEKAFAERVVDRDVTFF